MSSSTSSEVVAFVRRTQVSLSELQEAYKDLFDCAQVCTRACIRCVCFYEHMMSSCVIMSNVMKSPLSIILY